MLSFAAVGQGALERGVGAEGKGLDDLAESYYRQAADTNREAALRLGMLLERRERYLEAGSWLARGDSGAVAMAHIARCHTELGRWSDAKQAAEKAVELADESDKEVRSSAMASLALTYAAEESYTNALSWAHKAVEADPQSARALNATGIILFRRGDDNGAIQQFRKALQKDPQNTDAVFNLGTLYCYRGNHDLAISTLRKGL